MAEIIPTRMPTNPTTTTPAKAPAPKPKPAVNPAKNVKGPAPVKPIQKKPAPVKTAPKKKGGRPIGTRLDTSAPRQMSKCVHCGYLTCTRKKPGELTFCGKCGKPYIGE